MLRDKLTEMFANIIKIYSFVHLLIHIFLVFEKKLTRIGERIIVERIFSQFLPRILDF